MLSLRTSPLDISCLTASYEEIMMIHTPASVVRLPLVWVLGVLLLLTTRPGMALTCIMCMA